MNNFWEYVIKITYGQTILYEKNINNEENFDNFSNSTIPDGGILEEEVLNNAR